MQYGDALIPCLKVLPMGFNWGRHFAQLVSMETARRCGVSDADFVLDRMPGQVLTRDGPMKVAIYVDKYLVFGGDKEKVDRLATKLGEQFVRRGSRRTRSAAQSEFSFCGLEFSGKQGEVCLKLVCWNQTSESVLGSSPPI